MVKKNYDDILSRFHIVPERNGQTDGRTDGQTDLLYQYRASVCWRAIIRLYSTFCTVEANTDRHEASRGLFATAELLVINYTSVQVTVLNSLGVLTVIPAQTVQTTETRYILFPWLGYGLAVVVPRVAGCHLDVFAVRKQGQQVWLWRGWLCCDHSRVSWTAAGNYRPLRTVQPPAGSYISVTGDSGELVYFGVRQFCSRATAQTVFCTPTQAHKPTCTRGKSNVCDCVTATIRYIIRVVLQAYILQTLLSITNSPSIC